ncbi:hypothetical protein [Peribacillus loiseleuriae]|uniref:hypothetical protein n=1 Tax=Peribacillus loiseleuriae TaxID=1679170 RepID=UPI003D05BF97
MEHNKVKRFAIEGPSKFKVIALMTLRQQMDFITGEPKFALDCRIGSFKEPVNIAPFLESVEVLKA